jgi:ABC-type transport system involved in cytochrome c biogenesis permease subunit
MKKWLPWFIVAVAACFALSNALPVKETDFAWQSFGRIPALANGRYQPLDSLARNALLQLRGKASAISSTASSGPDKQRAIPAAEWLAEVMFQPEVAETRPVFRIDNPDLKQMLGLPVEPDEATKADGKHFSYKQIQPQIEALQEQARQAQSREEKARQSEEQKGQANPPEEKAAAQTPYDRAVLQLVKHLQLFWRLENLVQPRITDIIRALKAAPPEGADHFLKDVEETKPQDAVDWKREMNEYLDNTEAGRKAFLADRDGKPYNEKALTAFRRELVRLEAMAMNGQPFIIPPADPAKTPDAWRNTSDALMEAGGGATPHPALHAYAEMDDAFRSGRAADFNQAVKDYLAQLEPQYGNVLVKCRREVLFNRLDPFTNAMAIYVLVGVLGICFWFAPISGEWLRRTAMLLCLLALVIHTGGLVFRMALEGRPPVTNLYSAAVFIGWAACVLGLVLETVWRNSIGIIVSSIIGFSTLLIAYHLANAGDTMEMMRAVLDNNFWLSTHVVIVTLGYASTYVAGFLAIIFVVRGVFTTSLDATLRQSLTKMIYAIICFATLFSFVGTVLGGIWADQSWGRFWGWDPKENGALIIVLWNILILHARMGGMVRERGLANLAIFGNIVTTWSFFGTNMLGVGLHSYGRTDEQLLFIGSQAALILIGLLPVNLWRSFSTPGVKLPVGARTA